VGANEATVFTTNKDLMINDQLLKAGRYSMYAYPGKDTWQIVFNSDVDRWGLPAPDTDKDVIKTEVHSTTGAPVAEQFAITFTPADSGTVTMLWTWDETVVTAPLKVQ
jgi:hypothetical protein